MYKYHEQQSKLYNKDGVALVLMIYDNALQTSCHSTVFTDAELTRGCYGDSFIMLAAIDFLVETGRLVSVAEGTVRQSVIYRLRDN